MSLPRLHSPDLAVGVRELSSEESHHARHVLRLQSGCQVLLFDGAGSEGLATVTAVERNAMRVEVSQVIRGERDSSTRLTLAVAPPRAYRQNYLVEKCTELGVEAIWPITTERNVSRPSKATVARWSRRALEALKQCGGSWLPTIEPVQEFSSTLHRIGEFDLALIAQPGVESRSLGQALVDNDGARSVLVWVGPAGGWSEAEVEAAHGAGARSIRLGRNCLRTETAAVAVAAIVKATFVTGCCRG